MRKLRYLLPRNHTQNYFPNTIYTANFRNYFKKYRINEIPLYPGTDYTLPLSDLLSVQGEQFINTQSNIGEIRPRFIFADDYEYDNNIYCVPPSIIAAEQDRICSVLPTTTLDGFLISFERDTISEWPLYIVFYRSGDYLPYDLTQRKIFLKFFGVNQYDNGFEIVRFLEISPEKYLETGHSTNPAKKNLLYIIFKIDEQQIELQEKEIFCFITTNVPRLPTLTSSEYINRKFLYLPFKLNKKYINEDMIPTKGISFNTEITKNYSAGVGNLFFTQVPPAYIDKSSGKKYIYKDWGAYKNTISAPLAISTISFPNPVLYRPLGLLKRIVAYAVVPGWFLEESVEEINEEYITCDGEEYLRKREVYTAKRGFFVEYNYLDPEDGYNEKTTNVKFSNLEIIRSLQGEDIHFVKIIFIINEENISIPQKIYFAEYDRAREVILYEVCGLQGDHYIEQLPDERTNLYYSDHYGRATQIYYEPAFSLPAIISTKNKSYPDYPPYLEGKQNFFAKEFFSDEQKNFVSKQNLLDETSEFSVSGFYFFKRTSPTKIILPSEKLTIKIPIVNYDPIYVQRCVSHLNLGVCDTYNLMLQAEYSGQGTPEHLRGVSFIEFINLLLNKQPPVVYDFFSLLFRNTQICFYSAKNLDEAIARNGSYIILDDFLNKLTENNIDINNASAVIEFLLDKIYPNMNQFTIKDFDRTKNAFFVFTHYGGAYYDVETFWPRNIFENTNFSRYGLESLFVKYPSKVYTKLK